MTILHHLIDPSEPGMRRLILQSIPRRLKRLWLRVWGYPAYQCDGCLWFFGRRDRVTRQCKCGALLCRECVRKGAVAGCWCGC